MRQGFPLPRCDLRTILMKNITCRFLNIDMDVVVEELKAEESVGRTCSTIGSDGGS